MEEENVENYVLPDGTVYDGGIDDDGRPHGMGFNYQLINGERARLLEGEFQHGLMHGRGTKYALIRGQSWIYYSGQYHQGQPHGKGFLYNLMADQPNILLFEGEFKNGNQSKGKEYYPNGKIRHEGEFDEEGPNGEGKEYTKDGQVIREGNFLYRSVLHGDGKENNPLTGKPIYVGEFKEGVRHGIGKLYEKQGGFFLFYGVWKDGELYSHGPIFQLAPAGNPTFDVIKQQLIFTRREFFLAQRENRVFSSLLVEIQKQIVTREKVHVRQLYEKEEELTQQKHERNKMEKERNKANKRTISVVRKNIELQKKLKKQKMLNNLLRKSLLGKVVRRRKQKVLHIPQEERTVRET